MRTLQSTIARSNGKIIFSGEHSVVYGYPAVAQSIPLSLEIMVTENEVSQMYHPYFEYILEIFFDYFPQSQKNISLRLGDTQLPIGRGLGSSSAIAHAGFKGLATFNNIEINQSHLIELVQLAEKYAHETPSGLDATTVVVEKLLHFQNKDQKLTYKVIKTKVLKGQNFLLVDSGQPFESTKEMVMKVRQKPPSILAAMGELTTTLIANLEKDSFNPHILTENQRLLEQLGVVGEKAKAMIKEIEEVGGQAKITGAGGVQAGSGMILVVLNRSTESKILDLARRRSWPHYVLTF